MRAMQRRCFLTALAAAPIPAALVGLRDQAAAAPRLSARTDAQQLFVALYTADGEARYAAYKRAVVDRASWSMEIDSDGRPSFSNAESITFPEAVGGRCVVTFGVLFDPRGGGFAFPLSTPLAIWEGITPSFAPNSIRLG